MYEFAMPFRLTAARELGSLLGALSHPQRLLIVEELRLGERDVASLTSALQVAQPIISQHLNRLRLLHLVKERREGRQVFYQLCDPHLAEWLDAGLEIILQEARRAQEVADASMKARIAWSTAATGTEV